MNITKQKQTHRYRKQTSGDQWREGWWSKKKKEWDHERLHGRADIDDFDLRK